MPVKRFYDYVKNYTWFLFGLRCMEGKLFDLDSWPIKGNYQLKWQMLMFHKQFWRIIICFLRIKMLCKYAYFSFFIRYFCLLWFMSLFCIALYVSVLALPFLCSLVSVFWPVFWSLITATLWKGYICSLNLFC